MPHKHIEVLELSLEPEAAEIAKTAILLVGAGASPASLA